MSETILHCDYGVTITLKKVESPIGNACEISTSGISSIGDELEYEEYDAFETAQQTITGFILACYASGVDVTTDAFLNAVNQSLTDLANIE